jgi:peptide deformylase
MAILEILEAPHPILSAKARVVRVDELGEPLKKHLDDMAETMYAAPGVGLAAPQVGDPRRILVADPGFEGEDGKRMKGIDLLFMVNPEILERSEETINWDESCLSVPDYSQEVKRSKRIRVRWIDPMGTPFERVFEDFSAVVLQHELDHLMGTTLLEHSSRFKRGRYLTRQAKKRVGRK